MSMEPSRVLSRMSSFDEGLNNAEPAELRLMHTVETHVFGYRERSHIFLSFHIQYSIVSMITLLLQAALVYTSGADTGRGY
jgi:hypothetical protein